MHLPLFSGRSVQPACTIEIYTIKLFESTNH